MDLFETSRLAEIVEQVKGWAPESRILLARRILETLEPAKTRPRPPGARSVQQLIGMGAGGSPPPDDETVRRWIDEHRAEKYR
jgi:hypothetical protein